MMMTMMMVMMMMMMTMSLPSAYFDSEYPRPS